MVAALAVGHLIGGLTLVCIVHLAHVMRKISGVRLQWRVLQVFMVGATFRVETIAGVAFKRVEGFLGSSFAF